MLGSPVAMKRGNGELKCGGGEMAEENGGAV